VQGESFARLLHITKSAGKRVPREIVCSVLAAVLHGLHAAHEAKSERGEPLGIVHRDVSPQNILVGVDGISRVLDFGIAKAAGRAQVTREGQVRGKMAYIAPEQLQQGAADRKADVYAAAVVLWEALTGERLFLGESEAATIAKVLTGEVQKPSALVPDIPPELDAVVMRGLNRDRDVRFDTARDMARAIEACGPLSTPSAIGEWVEATAGNALSVRARIVSEVEQIEDFPVAEHSSRPPRILASAEEPTVAEVRTDGTPAESVPGPESEPNFHPHRRRRIVIVTAIVAFLFGLLALQLFLPERQPAPKPAAADTASAPAPSQPSAALPATEVASPAAASVEPAPVSPPQASVAKPDAAGRPKPGRAKPKSAQKTGCDPPYTIDQEGHRRYKMECL